MNKANTRNIPSYLWIEWEQIRKYLLSLKGVDLRKIKIAVDESK